MLLRRRDLLEVVHHQQERRSETLGGEPHDMYSMTLLSIRQCVLDLYKQLGLHYEGVDGNLGSSEF